MSFFFTLQHLIRNPLSAVPLTADIQLPPGLSNNADSNPEYRLICGVSISDGYGSVVELENSYKIAPQELSAVSLGNYFSRGSRSSSFTGDNTGALNVANNVAQSLNAAAYSGSELSEVDAVNLKLNVFSMLGDLVGQSQPASMVSALDSLTLGAVDTNVAASTLAIVDSLLASTGPFALQFSELTGVLRSLGNLMRRAAGGTTSRGFVGRRLLATETNETITTDSDSFLKSFDLLRQTLNAMASNFEIPGASGAFEFSPFSVEILSVAPERNFGNSTVIAGGENSNSPCSMAIEVPSSAGEPAIVARCMRGSPNPFNWAVRKASAGALLSDAVVVELTDAQGIAAHPSGAVFTLNFATSEPNCDEFLTAGLSGALRCTAVCKKFQPTTGLWVEDFQLKTINEGNGRVSCKTSSQGIYSVLASVDVSTEEIKEKTSSDDEFPWKLAVGLGVGLLAIFLIL